MVVSSNKEKYKCLIPTLDNESSETDTPYSGPIPFDLVLTLFSHNVCSYKIESYWTYELCHGQYLKQYHEEHDGKKVKLQEYFLGKWSKFHTEALRTKLEEADKTNEPLQYKRIEGLNLPYVEIEMQDGTLCDINNEPRVARVLYFCDAHGKNEIYSLKETSTCNYEIIVLTPVLCSHPSYRPHETTEYNINCLPTFDAPNIPRNLLALDVESMKMRYQKMTVSIVVIVFLYNYHDKHFVCTSISAANCYCCYCVETKNSKS